MDRMFRNELSCKNEVTLFSHVGVAVGNAEIFQLKKEQ